jgi:ubiquinone/menaquinone biosynthesis C-methylase UbiE
MSADPKGHVCPAAHSGWLYAPGRKLFNSPRRILAGLVGEGDIAVDLGCGPGFFSLPLAEMVGETGRVIAVDIQEEMLARLSLRAEQAGLAARIQPHHASPAAIGVTDHADFALAFWMVHEVRDKDGFLSEVFGILREVGRFLLVEPRGHVTKDEFRKTVERAQGAGFVPVTEPRVGFSRAVLFNRP